jgi:hypothetical protein
LIKRFETEALREISGPKSDEVSGKFSIPHNMDAVVADSKPNKYRQPEKHVIRI